MAAPLGSKTFTVGEVLSAADVNGYLMQGVLVFADSAARSAAITSPQEGQSSYLKDTDVIQVYSGTAWVTKSGGSSPLTTKGDLYTFSTSDARLAVGTDTYTLVADSAEATGLKWQAPAGGGKVLQVVSTTYGTEVNSSSATYVDAGLSLAITPTLNTSNILVLVSQPFSYYRSTNAAGGFLQLVRGATSIYETTGIRIYVAGTTPDPTAVQACNIQGISYLDSPATTSSTTYKMQMRVEAAGSSPIIEAQFTDYGASTATMILLEIGA